MHALLLSFGFDSSTAPCNRLVSDELTYIDTRSADADFMSTFAHLNRFTVLGFVGSSYCRFDIVHYCNAAPFLAHFHSIRSDNAARRVFLNMFAITAAIIAITLISFHVHPGSFRCAVGTEIFIYSEGIPAFRSSDTILLDAALRVHLSHEDLHSHN